MKGSCTIPSSDRRLAMRQISRAAFHGRRRTYVDATTVPPRPTPGLIPGINPHSNAG